MGDLLGKYEILTRLGAGSMGTVYRARDTVLQREVALKTIQTGPNVEPEIRERFHREALACAHLDHPNIITVYDLGTAERTTYIAMELLIGSDFRKIIDQRMPFPIDVKLGAMIQTCEALDHAHGKGIIHRDIKPSNLFLLKDGRAKVLDFGIARLPSSSLTVVGKILGTPNYMAPEQIIGNSTDGRADLFSAAVVFFEVLVYAHPFRATSIPRRIVEGAPDSLFDYDTAIPTILEKVINRGLAREPEKRYQTGDEFAADLRCVLDGIRQNASPTFSHFQLPSERERKIAATVPPSGHPTKPLIPGDDVHKQPAAHAVEEQNPAAPAVGASSFEGTLGLDASLLNSGPLLPPPQPSPVAIQSGAPGETAGEQRRVGALLLWARKFRVAIFAAALGLLTFILGIMAAHLFTAVKLEPAVATAVVVAPAADVYDSPSRQARRIASIKRGRRINIVGAKPSREMEWIRCQLVENRKPLRPGYIATSAIGEWSSDNPETALGLVRSFAPPDLSRADNIQAQIDRLRQMADRFSGTPQNREARLDADFLDLDLAAREKAVGQDGGAGWQLRLERVRRDLLELAGDPRLKDRAAEVQHRLETVQMPFSQEKQQQQNLVADTAATQREIKAMLEKADGLRRQYKYDQARSILRIVRRKDPHNPEAQRLLDLVDRAQKIEEGTAH